MRRKAGRGIDVDTGGVAKYTLPKLLVKYKPPSPYGKLHDELGGLP